MKAVAVIGAGVNGLTSGLELLRAGFEVTVFAAQISPNTTSNVAAAIWMPYKVQPQEQALRWAVGSLERFRGPSCWHFIQNPPRIA
jgi:D-amino-acid oxidase